MRSAWRSGCSGYRMPNQTEDMVKEKPVSLGAPAYKRLWPKAVWPGEISGAVPLAINAKFAYVNASTLNPDGTVTTSNNDFQFPQEVNIFGAGTLGDHISYLTEITFGENPDSSVSTELEHANIAFDSPFGPEDLLHIRIGKMMPNVVDGFQEMQIMTDAGIDSLFGYNPIGPNGGSGLAGDVEPGAHLSARERPRASRGTASSSTARCGWPGWPTASRRASTAGSTGTTRRTSTRGSTTSSAGWGSTATPAA